MELPAAAAREPVLVTGGTGYIGSHACVELLAAGYPVVALDNLCNSRRAVVARIEEVSGRPIAFHECDVRDRAAVQDVIKRHGVRAVLHFAGLKAVGDSVREPLSYYAANVGGSIALCEAMRACGVARLVFSSSATVYGDASSMPITEGATLQPANPYGHSKRMAEQVFEDLVAAEPQWSIVVLRYFNPAGAHPSGLMGEDPTGTPNNLMPFLTQVAVGRQPALRVFGRDYPTPDGTGVRDYVHVVDLAQGHVAALEATARQPGWHACNLGTGSGSSVLEFVHSFERATGCAVAIEDAPRRSGDIAASFADVRRAREWLGWEASRTLDDICRDAWRWQKANPQGYA